MSFTSAKRPPEQPKMMNFAPPQEKGRVLAFSGKIGAGKDTMCNWLSSMALVHVLGLAQQTRINDEGHIVVLDGGQEQILDLESRNPDVISELEEKVWPFIRKFGCADKLKDFCVNVLGLPEESVWGTHEQKNQLTHLKWEDMPTTVIKTLDLGEECPANCIKTGFMSGRDIMEYFGTQIVRKINPRSWAQALAKDIVSYNSAYSLVKDIRFPDECEEIHNIDGKVIRLTKITEEARENNHISNTALDSYDKFDAVLDNHDLTQEETFAKLYDILVGWDYFVWIN